jgi:hypothetical protein
METEVVYPRNYPHKLDSIGEAPEEFSRTLESHLPSGEKIPLIIYAPATSVGEEKLPATVFGITNDGWLLASESRGGVSVEKCKFDDTLLIELTSIVLEGQLKIDFASEGSSRSTAVQFSTVEERLYREAIDLLLEGIERSHASKSESDRSVEKVLKDWPLRFRNEAMQYLPKGQPLLAATQWPAILSGFQRELAPAGALLATERELVLFADEKMPEGYEGEWAKYGGIITYFPLVRLADIQVKSQERFSVLALQVHASHGGETLEIMFPSDHREAVSKVMEQMRSTRMGQSDTAMAA